MTNENRNFESPKQNLFCESPNPFCSFLMANKIIGNIVKRLLNHFYLIDIDNMRGIYISSWIVSMFKELIKWIEINYDKGESDFETHIWRASLEPVI